MSTPSASLPRFHAETRDVWRGWLEANHALARGVWLICWKQATGKPRVAYDEIVEEALCFGWIDSRPGALDAERAMLLVTPRKQGSPWSKLNKERVSRLTAEGRMAPAGLAAVEVAKRDGSWTAYDAIEALVVPDDLAVALDEHPRAREGFDAFSTTDKKQLLWWVVSARRAPTRSDRIARVVEGALARRNPLNRRANQRRRDVMPT